jgi:signal transduction histidine kinase
MKDKAKTENLFARLKHHSLFLVLLWTGCIAASLLWNLYEQREKILKIARNSAQITFENDILYRRWAAKHGGVYVPASEHTPPNPYLNVPERDVTTSSGLSLTLVNPAYMARQVNQMAADSHGSQGHITSLNPIRPENKPDPWETIALKSFEKGIQEVSSVEKMAGQEYMRLMRPFIAEEACLKCHASQGYKAGDVRGGISVSIPMAPLWAIEKPLITRISLAHLLLWMVGIGGIVISKKGLEKEILARQKAEAVLSEAHNKLEQRVQERTTELAKANEALRNISSRILSAQEEERKRIAGEIHDSLGGCLSGIKFKVEDVLQQMGKAPNVIAQSLGTLIPVIQEGVEECRRIQMDLRPSMLDDLGLLDTLSWFCRRFQTIYSGIRVEQEVAIEESEIPGPLKIVIYRITQEAMNNIAKHSKADVVRLSVRKRADRMELVLQDNGQGFNPEKARSQENPKRGLGLLSMKERTELSGGSLAIESEEGKGTLVRASWPLPAPPS